MLKCNVWEVCLLAKDRTVVYTCTRNLIGHNQANSYYVFHSFVRARIAFHRIKRLASTEQWHANHKSRCFLVMRKCVCGEHIEGMCQFSHLSSIANTLRPQWPERHLHIVLSKLLDIYRHSWSNMVLCHCRIKLQLFIKQPREYKCVSYLFKSF